MTSDSHWSLVTSHWSLVVDDLELDLDQTERISRRIAHGVYRLSHARKPIGEEVWGIFGLRGNADTPGGYRLMSEIDSRWPLPNQQRARLDLDENWAARKLWAEVDAGNARRTAIYEVNRSARSVLISITESLLRYADGGKGNNKQGKANTELVLKAPDAGKLVYEDQLPFDENTYLDFGSTLFNFAHLKRVDMSKDKATIKAIVVKLPSLEPLPLTQTYEYVTEEPVNSLLYTQQLAHCYRIVETDGGSAVTTFWSDAHGIILKQDVKWKNEWHGCELTSYKWVG
jgi:hypothetical protein